MSESELDHSSDRKPEGFDQLVNDIILTHKEPGNNSIQEVVLRRCVKYLNDNNLGSHWFCDPYIYPVAVHTMILFSSWIMMSYNGLSLKWLIALINVKNVYGILIEGNQLFVTILQRIEIFL